MFVRSLVRSYVRPFLPSFVLLFVRPTVLPSVRPFVHSSVSLCETEKDKGHSVATRRVTTRRVASRRGATRRDASRRVATRRDASRRHASRRDASRRDASRRVEKEGWVEHEMDTVRAMEMEVTTSTLSSMLITSQNHYASETTRPRRRPRRLRFHRSAGR